jgi:hypothetical protein
MNETPQSDPNARVRVRVIWNMIRSDKGRRGRRTFRSCARRSVIEE